MGTPATEPYEATLQQVALIAAKRERLLAAQIEAEEQLLHRVATDYNAHRGVDLLAVYDAYRAAAAPGYTKRWDQHLPVTAAKIRTRIPFHPNGPHGTWTGAFPVADQPRPPRGQPVVYVLYDADNVPCYVGSSEDFGTRAKAHAAGGKTFTRWQAHPCATRAAAYALEDVLLKQHKPYLNKRAGR